MIRIPEARTRSAATGSTWKLNSAAAVTLPGASIAPPITIRRPTRCIAGSSASSARAMFCERTEGDDGERFPVLAGLGHDRRRRAAAGRRRSTARGIEEAAAAVPEPGESGQPVVAVHVGGGVQPSAKGGARRRAPGGAARQGRGARAGGVRCRSPRAARCCRATVVMSSTRNSGERSASTMASASSMPGSVSMTTGCGPRCSTMSNSPILASSDIDSLRCRTDARVGVARPSNAGRRESTIFGDRRLAEAPDVVA